MLIGDRDDFAIEVMSEPHLKAHQRYGGECAFTSAISRLAISRTSTARFTVLTAILNSSQPSTYHFGQLIQRINVRTDS